VIRRFQLCLVVLMLALAAFAAAGSAANVTAPLLIGVVGDIDASVHTSDGPSIEGVKLAARDLNAVLERIGSERRIELVFEDTDAEPELAATAVARLAEMGVRLIIGPYSSAEARAMMPVLDELGIVAISPSSTIPDLAVEDNLLRFAPNDRLQARALASLYAVHGIAAVVPVVQDDPYGWGLLSALTEYVPAGVVLLQEVPFPVGDLTGSVDELEERVSAAVAEYGERSVAVQFIGFDELVGAASRLSASPVLSRVRWYGGDALASSAVLTASEEAAAFAIAVDLTATLPSPAIDTDNARPVIDDLHRAGYSNVALTYPLTAYDALTVAARAALIAGDAAGPEGLKEAILSELKWFSGLTGRVVLDRYGDRIEYDYYYMGVSRLPGAGSGATWVFLGRWSDK